MVVSTRFYSKASEFWSKIEMQLSSNLAIQNLAIEMNYNDISNLFVTVIIKVISFTNMYTFIDI